MDRFKKYGKWFLIVVAVVALVLLIVLVSIGLPIWLALPLALIGALPATVGLAAIGVIGWLESDLGPDAAELERAERDAGIREGQAFLDRSKQGRPRRKR